MTYNWNTAFEGFPAGSKQGLTMGEALRRLKAAFYERMIVEHTISEGAAPTVVHPVGECGIVLIVDEEDTPLSEYIDGGLQYKAPAFYRDDGSALTDFLPDTHTEFIGLITDAEHPQYVPHAGGDFSADGLIWTLDNLTGLEQAGEQYNPRSGSVDQTAVQGTLAHTSVAADGYPKHSEGCIVAGTSKVAGSFYLGYGKYQHTVKNQAAVGDTVFFEDFRGTLAKPDFAADFYKVDAITGAYGLELISDSGAGFNVDWMKID